MDIKFLVFVVFAFAVFCFFGGNTIGNYKTLLDKNPKSLKATLSYIGSYALLALTYASFTYSYWNN